MLLVMLNCFMRCMYSSAGSNLEINWNLETSEIKYNLFSIISL